MNWTSNISITITSLTRQNDYQVEIRKEPAVNVNINAVD